MTRETSERWSSRSGFILATIGSAVGLGSIWKFPYEVGENGGGTFLLFYLLGLLLVVFPLAEFIIGRHARGGAATSIRRIAVKSDRSPRWSIVGLIGIAAGFLILTYYAVIAGMTMAMCRSPWHRALTAPTPQKRAKSLGRSRSPAIIDLRLIAALVSFRHARPDEVAQGRIGFSAPSRPVSSFAAAGSD